MTGGGGERRTETGKESEEPYIINIRYHKHEISMLRIDNN